MQTYLAAAVQLNSTSDLVANLDQAAALISKAAACDAKLIALPENFSFLGPEDEKLRRAGEITAHSELFLKKQARSHHVFLLGGGHPAPASSGKTYNRSLLIGPDGEVKAQYDKIHLFDVDLPSQSLRESDTVEPGHKLVHIHDNTLGCVVLSICYDIRFPELYRLLSARGADVILVPAAFTAYTGKDHWEVLLRARAIENTCYVIAPAQCGHHFGKRDSYGHALIVDPWGHVLADAGSEPGIALAEVSPKRIGDVRMTLPSLRHRKL